MNHMALNNGVHVCSPQKTPTHNLQVYELRGSWNKENRTVLIGLYDSYMKAQALRRNLSAEALKGFKVEGGGNVNNVSNSSCKTHTVIL